MRMRLRYQRLAFLHIGQFAWQMRPKLNYGVAHLSGQAKLMNPPYAQTFGAQGLVGKVCKPL